MAKVIAKIIRRNDESIDDFKARCSSAQMNLPSDGCYAVGRYAELTPGVLDNGKAQILWGSFYKGELPSDICLIATIQNVECRNNFLHYDISDLKTASVFG